LENFFQVLLKLYLSYKEEPNPEYAPKIKLPTTAITPKPPTSATNQRGILPVPAIFLYLLDKTVLLIFFS
jgi:hypothetical protein